MGLSNLRLKIRRPFEGFLVRFRVQCDLPIE